MPVFAARFLPLLLLLVVPAFLSAVELETEAWRDERPGQGIESLRYWSALAGVENGDIVQEKGERFLLLKDGTKLQSLRAAPYPEVLTLEAEFSVSGEKATAGYGTIDFSSSSYYYVYLDVDKKQWLLQKGDGKGSEVLGTAEAKVAPGQRYKVVLEMDFRQPKELKLAVKVDGIPVIEKTEARSEDLGSTFQIYIGVGDATEARFYKISRIAGRY